MLLFISGDFQLDDRPGYDRIDPATSRSTRFDENVATIEAAIQSGLTLGCEGFLFGGDLTEHKNPSSVVMDAAAHLFNIPLKAGRRWWAIPGNHDGSMFEVSGSSISPLAKMRGDEFKIYNRVEYDAELCAMMVPYIHRASPATIREMITQAAGSAAASAAAQSFMLAHYAFKESLVGPKNLTVPGDYLDRETISFPGLDHVFNAHIHKAQEIDYGDVKVHGAGSPVIVDMGERNDEKLFLIFDTDTRVVTRHPIQQRHRWVAVNWPVTPGQWEANDILCVKGEHDAGTNPKEVLEAAFKSGELPIPFRYEVETKPRRPERVARAATVTAEGGLRGALQTFVRDVYERTSDTPGPVGPATAAVMGVLRDQGATLFHPIVTPTRVWATNFRTYKTLDMPLEHGHPLLITGPNGFGKTNLLQLMLFVMFGKTTKSPGLASSVRRGESSCEGGMEFVGSSPEAEDQRYRIVRTVKLSKAGVAQQDIAFERWDKISGIWDKSLSDGGVVERQARIDNFLGGSFETICATNFKIQQDRNRIILRPPESRRTIIDEATGGAALKAAWKVLDARRLVSGRAWQTGRDRLAGLETGAEGAAERVVVLRGELLAAEGGRGAAAAAVTGAEAAKTAADGALTAARETERGIQGKIAAIPNTEAELLAAVTARDTYESTYTTERERKLARHAEAKGLLSAAEGELKAAQPAEGTLSVEALEAIAAAHQGALKTATENRDAYASNSSVAAAKLEAAAAVEVALEKEVAEAEKDPALAFTGDEAATAAPIPGLLAEVKTAEQDHLARSTEYTTIQSEIKVLEKTMLDLSEEAKAFDGKDIGTCARCGQPIDSSHIEKEKSRIGAEEKTAWESLGKKRAEAVTAGTALAAAETAKSVAAKNLAQTQEDLNAVRLQLQSKTTAGSRLAELRVKLASAYEAGAAAKKAFDIADASAIEAGGIYAKAYDANLEAATNLTVAQALTASLTALTTRITELQRQLSELVETGRREAAEHTTRTAALAQAVTVAEAKDLEARSMMTMLRTQLGVAQTTVTNTSEAATRAAVALETARAALAAITTQITTLTSQIADLDSRLKTISDTRADLALAQERAEIDALAPVLVDGLRGCLIDQSLPELEDAANGYLEKLGMPELSIELTSLADDKESLCILVDDGQPGPKLDVLDYSGGQHDRIEYAMKCALADLKRKNRGVTLGLSAFDEPSEGLNDEGKKALIALLVERCVMYPVTLVISHDDALAQAFDYKLTVGRGVNNETVLGNV